MWLKRFWANALILLGGLLLAGCAHQPPRVNAGASPDGFPYVLRGADTRIRLDFHAHPKVADAVELSSDELCYLSAGDTVVLCHGEGSYLLLGPKDGIELVDSNPLWRLRPVGRDPAAGALLRVYGTIFMIAGSLDRLPDALADYLDEPGAHRRQALNLARKLLDPNGMELPAVAHGGTFTVFLTLTASGRDKLLEALQANEDKTGLRLVRQPQ